MCVPVLRGPAWFVSLVAAGVLAACGADPAPSSSRGSAPAGAPRPAASAPSSETPAAATDGPRGYPGVLPPLPVAPFAAARPQPVVQAAYEFAARHPEVLRYVPCFCGCERNGHADNEDCFVAGRDADGKPRWETHGMG